MRGSRREERYRLEGRKSLPLASAYGAGLAVVAVHGSTRPDELVQGSDPRLRGGGIGYRFYPGGIGEGGGGEGTGQTHNSLAAIQGGVAGEHYHFQEAIHTALAGLYGWADEFMERAYVERVSFRSIEAVSPLKRSHMMEMDGDWYWFNQCRYDEGSGYWKRDAASGYDPAKNSYMVVFHSESPVVGETVGGIAFWRATPNAALPDPEVIGNWTYQYHTIGGWELGFMMTQDRNYVVGGMNIEMDGSGAPPYGRFTHIASNDPAAEHTLMQQNSWYEAVDSWGRDAVEDSYAYGVDKDGKWFWWKYPSTSSSPWLTAAWTEIASLDANGNLQIDGTITIGGYALPNTDGANAQVLVSNGAGVVTWQDQAGGGSGDVVGPASATDNALARFDGATGKLIQNSGVIISDGGDVSLPADANLYLDGGTSRGIFPSSNLDVQYDAGSLISVRSGVIFIKFGGNWEYGFGSTAFWDYSGGSIDLGTPEKPWRDLNLSGELKGSRTSFVLSRLSPPGGAYIYVYAGEVLTSLDKGLIMLRPGSIVGVSIQYDVTGSEDPVSLQVLKNGVSVWSNLISNAVGTEKAEYFTQARGIDTFAAGDDLQVRTAEAAPGPYTAFDDMIVSLEVVYDT